ncbi:ester hydrolase C11orf54 homolog isoform X1 [Diorhabda carinulata]|uniref:ester hydrolase C11orf54 homolog isoform X1 n=2 Tax=Diorhabda carinulata TaxID=1163345 RepID=UPI0025A1C723|nr:ester hydrolase C11orf54 homolog isoform X1 [Diorhabda carinulata]
MKPFLFVLVSLSLRRTMALNAECLPMESKKLFVPPLPELAKVIQKTLLTNFAEVCVEVVDCPDLTKEPFTLAASGLSGSQKLVEIGGNPYLLPCVQREKIYELKDIVKLVKSDPAFIIGPGAGPNPYIGANCEGIYNLLIESGSVTKQLTRISKVDENDDKSVQILLPDNETRLALLGNLYFSEGKPGKVIKVHAKKRIGEHNLITAIRTAVENEYKDKLVGIGGVFLLKEGKAKQHVMRDFSKTPIKNEEMLNKWLKFYNMSAPLIAVGTLVNGDGGLDLRVQHFHSFSHHGEAGHYHYDTTPETVEYLGYFNVGEEIYRIDRPINTHTWGRD